MQRGPAGSHRGCPCRGLPKREAHPFLLAPSASGRTGRPPRLQPPLWGSVTLLESFGNFLRKLLSDPSFPVSVLLLIPRFKRCYSFFPNCALFPCFNVLISASFYYPSCLSQAYFVPSLARLSKPWLVALCSAAFRHRLAGRPGLGSVFTLFFSTCCNVSADVLLSPGSVNRKPRCSQGWTKLFPLASALVPDFVALWSEDTLLSTFTLKVEVFFEA